MKKYNKKEIVSIKIFPEKINDNIIYLKGRKGFLGLFKRVEGFYRLGVVYGIDSEFGPRQNIYLLDKIPDNCYQKNNTIFYKPHIVIIFSNNDKEKIWFNNEKECSLYIKRNFQNIDWIDIK